MAAIIDEADGKILAILEKNAKARIAAIAKKTGMPASTVHHRIKRMEKVGVIAGWGIRKDFRKMGFGIKAHVLIFVDLASIKKMRKTQADISAELGRIPGVENSEIVTGEADLMITVRARDIDEFRRILLERIQAVEGITETKTMMVIA
jgi:Lrp/AsnC family transcriptional regulator, leucine-responsive regulatory protein